MSGHTDTRGRDAGGNGSACVFGWPGLDADAAAGFAAPLRTYPRLMMTAYSAWFEMGSELVMGSIAANQRLLRLLSEQWSSPDRHNAAAFQATMLEATREAVTRPVEVITRFQQRLLGACESVGPDTGVSAPHSDTAATPTEIPGATRQARQNAGARP